MLRFWNFGENIDNCNQCSCFSSQRHRTDRARGRGNPWELINSRVEATFQNSRIQKQESACSQERRRGLSRHCRVFKSEARSKVQSGGSGVWSSWFSQKKKEVLLYLSQLLLHVLLYFLAPPLGYVFLYLQLLFHITSSCISFSLLTNGWYLHKGYNGRQQSFARCFGFK